MKRATVILLAGGKASRMPGKLAHASSGVPLLVRAYRNIAGTRDIVLSCTATLDPALAAQLPVPFALDRYDDRGPLGGLVSTMETLAAERVFAIAGDMPFVDAAFLDRLEASYDDAYEALVPAYERDGRRHVEPLAALYDRAALLREATRELWSGRGSVRNTIDKLQTRYMDGEDPRTFTNLNTPADFAALEAQERQHA